MSAVNMRVNKVRLSEDTGIEACGETMGLGSDVVSSVEEVDGSVGLVFTFSFVWLSCAAVGAAGSPQVVCRGVTTEAVLDGWETCSCLHFSTYVSA
jgi:hypothetical protein